MASIAQWVEGARPRTLPNAIAPVIAGTGAAAWLGAASWWKALLAMLVAVGMIVGVNYANDYSDGIRGTDDVRSGPLRLVGSRLAAPRSVLMAAVLALAVGAVAGVVLAWVSAREHSNGVPGAAAASVQMQRDHALASDAASSERDHALEWASQQRAGVGRQTRLRDVVLVR